MHSSRRTVLLQLATAVSSAVCVAPGCAKGGLRHVAQFDRHLQPRSSQGAVTARFLGTASVLFEDDRTAILSDGFVTRPGPLDLLGRIRPHERRIDGALKRLGVSSIAAVFAGHSHYDHAMDAPVFAQRTGAVLLGSESTWNIGWGRGLRECQLRVVHDGETLRFDNFELTFIESRHSPDDLAPGRVDVPLVPPARLRAWRSDRTWSELIRHDNSRTLLVHGSAGYKPGALFGRRADVVYLGVGALGRQSEAFVDAYWQEVVGQTGAKRVILVHWDDFFQNLDEPLRPLRSPGNSFDDVMRKIVCRADASGVEVLLPLAWEPTDPFADLE